MLKKKSIEGSCRLDDWIQVRRCHRCGGMHEVRGERVDRCDDCGARFAPFFFAELTPEVLMDAADVPSVKPRSLALKDARNYRAIVGVTWWWCESNSAAGETQMPRA